ATLGIPGTTGVPAAAVSETIVAPYNVVPELDDRVAAVIVEPVAANMGVVAPAPGFLEGLRAACDRVGALLVFDEVITGFRLAWGGFQAASPVRPDLTCFGKVIGGGLPIGAVGGRAEVMEHLSPLGPVFHAGTLAGNPLATAAGLATLDLLVPGAYTQLEATAARLAAGLAAASSAHGLPVTAPRVGTLVGLHCSVTPAVDYETAKTTDTALYARLFHALLERGVALAPGAYEALFPGLAHTDAVMDELLSAADSAFATVSTTR
ncbi:MAG TPA: aminotransferase class III-fold pyridoxal phosphate-dependent enzyme, partial [Acidimicrobiales bacterium]